MNKEISDLSRKFKEIAREDALIPEHTRIKEQAELDKARRIMETAPSMYHIIMSIPFGQRSPAVINLIKYIEGSR